MSDIEKIKLLVVIGSLDSGGAEKHLIKILPKLKNKNIEPLVYCISHRGTLAEVLVQNDVNVETGYFTEKIIKFKYPGRKLIVGAISMIDLILLLHKNKPTIVHCYLPLAILTAGFCAYFLKIPYIICSRRSLNCYQLKHPILSLIEKWLLVKVSAVLGNSQAVCRELQLEGVNKEKLGLIYNGIDISVFKNKQWRDKCRSELGIKNNQIVLLMTANLISYKGHEDLLKAMANIKHDINNWLIIFAGRDEGIGSKLKEIANKLEIGSNVMFIGECTNIKRLIAASDIGILCSHQEGFSNSLLEYMAGALPVVATNVGGNPEAVVDNTTGFLVQPSAPKSLGTAIRQLILNPKLRQSMGQTGREHVDKYYSLDTSVQRYTNLYNGLISGKNISVQEMIDSSINI